MRWRSGYCWCGGVCVFQSVLSLCVRARVCVCHPVELTEQFALTGQFVFVLERDWKKAKMSFNPLTTPARTHTHTLAGSFWVPMTEDNLATGQKASKSSVIKDVKQTDFVIVVCLRGCTDVCLCQPVCAVMFECVCVRGCVCVCACYQQHAGLLPRQAFSRLLFLLLPLSIRHSHSQTHTHIRSTFLSFLHAVENKRVKATEVF